MKLPQREFYKLDEVAAILDCSFSDVLYYCSIDILHAYTYIDIEDKYEFLFNIGMHEDIRKKIDCFKSLCYGDWCAYGVEFHQRTDKLPVDGMYAKKLDGVFFIDGYCLKSLIFNGEDSFKIDCFSDLHLEATENEVNFNCLDFCLTIKTDSLRIKSNEVNDLKLKSMNESDKTVAKKAEIISCLIKLIPEMSDVNLDTTPVAKIASLIEAVAATRAVEFPKTDIGTWSKYLGRGRHKK
ncbi:hypothetical protein VQZ12_000799 [Salmonella enterica]|uniref:Uncharacterized protein n=1 Tax=Salmonella enterica TaxID=28901 RepID=A0A744FFM4_SALER|nr:hypothetical protein [Salmonella enterica subsp. enterica serovar Muenchen]EDQ3994971.1 hypothetical protein [Salmonella enterica subsp. enterica]EDW4550797.1 hypothetical protein [Salmonella enterica subsp. salamae]EJK8887975.1 hypothetical protein [Salmonella enterica]EBW2622258.1 hypothetical protein [Salmonella enterica subsp. enterica serovar Muenchen]